MALKGSAVIIVAEKRMCVKKLPILKSLRFGAVVCLV